MAQPALQGAPAQGGIDHCVAVRRQIPEGNEIAFIRQLRGSLQRFLPWQVGPAGKLGEAAGSPLLGDAYDDVVAGSLVQGHQPLRDIGVEAAMAAPGVGVHHLPSTESALRGAHTK